MYSHQRPSLKSIGGRSKTCSIMVANLQRSCYVYNDMNCPRCGRPCQRWPYPWPRGPSYAWLCRVCRVWWDTPKIGDTEDRGELCKSPPS